VYSRVTLLEVDTMRATVDEAVELFRGVVLPHLRELDGFEGVLVLATPEGKGMLVSFWGSEEAAEASTAFAAAEVERYVTMFRAPPGREQYEVVVAELPGVPVG
jgi:heme-degrading monooxygenase HmoA